MKPFAGPGSTPSRRRFWDQVTDAVNASRKIAGQFVTVDEHPGMGTVVNVDDTSSRRPAGGTCPDVESITMISDGIQICTDCIDLTDTPFGNQGSFLIYANYLNTTKIVPFFATGLWQTDDPTFGIGQLDYPGDAPTPCECPPETPDCTTTEDPTGLHFQIMCTDGIWKMALETATFIHFMAVGITDPTVPVANQLTTCGELIEDPDFGAVWTGSLGGTVTLSF